MKINDIKYFLNSLSTDFNKLKVSVKLGGQNYDIRDFKLFNDKLEIIAEENFKETLFDEIGSSLRCMDWNRQYKLQMVKALKEATDLGLKEAKEIIDDDRSFVVATGKTKSEYLQMIEKFPDHAKFDMD